MILQISARNMHACGELYIGIYIPGLLGLKKDLHIVDAITQLCADAIIEKGVEILKLIKDGLREELDRRQIIRISGGLARSRCRRSQNED